MSSVSNYPSPKNFHLKPQRLDVAIQYNHLTTFFLELHNNSQSHQIPCIPFYRNITNRMTAVFQNKNSLSVAYQTLLTEIGPFRNPNNFHYQNREIDNLRETLIKHQLQLTLNPIIFHAIQTKNLTELQYALNRSVYSNMKNDEGQTALNCAYLNECPPEMIDALLKHEARLTGDVKASSSTVEFDWLNFAIENNDEEFLIKCLNDGHLFTLKGHDKFVVFLKTATDKAELINAARPALKQSNNYLPPLHLFAKYGLNQELIRELETNPRSIDLKRGKNKETALHLAGSEFLHATSLILLFYGADPLSENRLGKKSASFVAQIYRDLSDTRERYNKISKELSNIPNSNKDRQLLQFLINKLLAYSLKPNKELKAMVKKTLVRYDETYV